MRLFSLPLFALSLIACPGLVLSQSAGSGDKAPLLLQRIIIPRLEFRDATPAEALQFLARKASELDTTAPEGTKRRVEFAPKDLPTTRITLSLDNVSLDEAIRHTAALAGVRVTFTADAFRIDVPPRGSLPPLGSRLDDTRLSQAQRTMLDKAGRLIVPRLEFREATVREAADFLGRKSREVDVEEPQPIYRGVNVMLITTPNWDGGDRLTLSRENIPLLELLTTIARMSGSELRLSNAAFILDFTDAKAAPAKTAP